MWRCKDHEQELVDNLLCSKRMHLDEVLATVDGIHFFISSITGITKSNKSKSKKRKQNDEDSEGADATKSTQEELDNIKESCASLFNRGIAYFIAYTPSNTCNQEEILRGLHEEEMTCNVTTIKTRVTEAENSDEREPLFQELCQVLKDHNNPIMQRLVDNSNQFCFSRSLADLFPSENDPDRFKMFSRGQAPRPSSNDIWVWPSHIYVVNERDFGDKLHKAKKKMCGKDGIIVGIVRLMRQHTETLPTMRVSAEAPKDISVCIDRIKNTMRAMDHVLYRDQIFAKAKGAKYIFLRMASVKEYLNKLLMNETLRDGIITNLFKIKALLSAECCEIIGQLKIDLDLNEVFDGQCFSILKENSFPVQYVKTKLELYHLECIFRMTALRPLRQNTSSSPPKSRSRIMKQKPTF